MLSRTGALGILCLIVVGVLLAGACFGEPQENARKVVEANKDCVVTIQVVEEMSVSYEGQTDKRQRKMTASGTVIDPGGLVVTSLSEIDSNESWEAEMYGEEEGFNFTSTVISCTIRTGSGQELASDVILRDKDLDLAFIKPKKAPEKPMSYVDLTQEGKPQMMDYVVYPTRLGRIGGYATAGYLDQVTAVLTKPRLFYVVSYGYEGCPAFTLDGKPVGISVWRNEPAASEDEEGDYMSIVLPCSTVLKIAEQAKAVK